MVLVTRRLRASTRTGTSPSTRVARPVVFLIGWRFPLLHLKVFCVGGFFLSLSDAFAMSWLACSFVVKPPPRRSSVKSEGSLRVGQPSPVARSSRVGDMLHPPQRSRRLLGSGPSRGGEDGWIDPRTYPNLYKARPRNVAHMV